MYSIKLTSIAVVALVAGCATNAVEADYGHSVHQMILNQSVNGDKSATDRIVEGANPDMLNAAIKEVQTDVGKGSDVRGNGNANSGSGSGNSSGAPTPTQ